MTSISVFVCIFFSGVHQGRMGRGGEGGPLSSGRLFKQERGRLFCKQERGGEDSLSIGRRLKQERGREVSTACLLGGFSVTRRGEGRGGLLVYGETILEAGDGEDSLYPGRLLCKQGRGRTPCNIFVSWCEGEGGPLHWDQRCQQRNSDTLGVNDTRG